MHLQVSGQSSEVDYSGEELMYFIRKMKIGIMAPYLAKTFEESSLMNCSILGGSRFGTGNLPKITYWKGKKPESLI